MFRGIAVRNQLTYGESEKMSRDFLLQHFRSDSVAQSADTTWADVATKVVQPNQISFTQNSVCRHCAIFLLDLVGRRIQQAKGVANVQGRSEIIVAEPPLRKIDQVVRAATVGCWICTHVTRNAARGKEDNIAAKSVGLQAYNFSPDEFSICAYGTKPEHHYKADFRIQPCEPPAGSHRVFALGDEEAKSIWRPDGLHKARTWIQSCLKEHDNCREHVGESRSYPKRLLDLTGVDQGYVALVPGPSISEDAKYATLSHCWGGVRRSVLLQSNITEYSTRIPVDILPKTFSDAIEICVDLEVRFLWIDSLCIVQDDQVEWAAEAPRMAEIYSNALVNLAASASRSDDGGLLRTLDRCLVSPLIFRPADDTGADHHFKVESDENIGTYVNGAPLNSRAWVFQERALSRRIIHFTNDQIYWQCASKIDAQFDLRIDFLDKVMPSPWQSMQHWSATPVTNRELEGGVPNHERSDLAHGHPDEHPLLNKWDDIVQGYSKCNLTYTSDKLVALAGLAKRTQWLTQWPDTDYLAGLWRHGLERRLLWRRFGRSNSAENPSIPSWSWAHINSEVIWPLMIWTEKKNTTGQIIAEVVSASVQREDSALGSVKAGVIRMRGFLCQTNLRRSLWEDWHPAGKVRLGDKWHPITHLEADFDLATSRWCAFGHELFFLPILSRCFISPEGTQKPGHMNRAFYGLMLKPTGKQSGQYRRVGALTIEDGAYDLALQCFASRLASKYFDEAGADNKYIIEIV